MITFATQRKIGLAKWNKRFKQAIMRFHFQHLKHKQYTENKTLLSEDMGVGKRKAHLSYLLYVRYIYILLSQYNKAHH